MLAVLVAGCGERDDGDLDGVLDGAVGDDGVVAGDGDAGRDPAAEGDAPPVDWCETGGLYGNGSCDPDCPREDPDCAGPRLEIYVLDLWGRPLADPSAALSVSIDGRVVASSIPVSALVLGSSPATILVKVDAEDFYPFEVALSYDGRNEQSAIAAGVPSPPFGHALSASADLAGRKWVHGVYLGVRHRWFSAVGSPPRRGNRVSFLMDGEESWSLVASELRRSPRSVYVSTWWWESTFELLRGSMDNIYATPEQRWPNTIMGMLEALPSGADRKVLVNQFVSQDGMLQDFNVDELLLAKGAAAGDNFEFMGQANPTVDNYDFEVETFLFASRVRESFPDLGARTFLPEEPVPSPVPGHFVDISLPLGIEGLSAASYHQKFIVVDGTTAFVGGMNMRVTDWDTSGHVVFDPRRMEYEATTGERRAVASREAESDAGPRKDIQVFVDGPIVQDVAEVFKARWDYVRAQGVRFAGNSSTFAVNRTLPSHDDGVEAQVTVTMPAPFDRHSTADSWYNALRSATRYIYIEDQYFRAPMLNEVIIERMTQVPDLYLVIVTKAMNEWVDPGCWWTYISFNEIAGRFPGRVSTYLLRSFDYVDVGWGIDETECRFADMDTHTKLLIVDDVFVSVGSTNHNNRGLVYEGEMNVAVHDAAFARDARRRIFENIVGIYYRDSDDAFETVRDLYNAALHNNQVLERWNAEGGDISLDGAPLPTEYRPEGFIYFLGFNQPDDCLIEGVSPDLTVM